MNVNDDFKQNRPKILNIYDDMGECTRHMENFTNECRHMGVSNIFLMHSYTDISPRSKKSINYYVFTQPFMITKKLLKDMEINEDLVHEVVRLVELHKSNKKRIYYIIHDNKVSYYSIDEKKMDAINSNPFLFTTDSSLKRTIVNHLQSLSNQLESNISV